MNGLWVIVVLVCLGGIILLRGKSPFKKSTREQFLRDLAEFLEGTLEIIEGEGNENSFRIRFEFEGEEFVYEDFQKQGFRNKVYKSRLKAETPSKLTLMFTERERSVKIKSDVFIASEVPSYPVNEYIPLQIPEDLKSLKVFTNDPNETNRIFEDSRIANTFKKFKNVDSMGHSFSSIRIVDGAVILEFYSTRNCTPNLPALQSDIPLIEDYLERLKVIIRKLKEESK